MKDLFIGSSIGIASAVGVILVGVHINWPLAIILFVIANIGFGILFYRTRKEQIDRSRNEKESRQESSQTAS